MSTGVAEWDRIEAVARTVQCVTCSAKPGQPCMRVTPVGRVRSRLAHPLRHASVGSQTAEGGLK